MDIDNNIKVPEQYKIQKNNYEMLRQKFLKKSEENK